MERQTLVFATERETKNTVRFQEEANGKPPVIGTLYVQRWALGEPLPQRLTVTIEAASAYVTPERPHACRTGGSGRPRFLLTMTGPACASRNPDH